MESRGIEWFCRLIVEMIYESGYWLDLIYTGFLADFNEGVVEISDTI